MIDPGLREASRAVRAEWPYSSFHRMVRVVMYSPDWGGGDYMEANFGE